MKIKKEVIIIFNVANLFQRSVILQHNPEAYRCICLFWARVWKISYL